ncbi:MAG: hypothetical protein OEM94_02575 [Acidimicrobiia bacterium]|nr:hypothetical protein [Acidimicrobiia bacterium]
MPETKATYLSPLHETVSRTATDFWNDSCSIEERYDPIPDFRMAYDEDGLRIEQFDTYGATVRTLRGFIASYHELIRVIREGFMLPNPDVT